MKDAMAIANQTNRNKVLGEDDIFMNNNKVFVIGIDGMDPKMTRRMVDEG